MSCRAAPGVRWPLAVVLAAALSALLWLAAAPAAHAYDYLAAPDDLRVTAATMLGGTGVDDVRAIDVAPGGTIVAGGVVPGHNPGGIKPQALLGGGAGAIVRLDASGRSVLSVTRIGASVNDLEVDGEGRIAVVGSFGAAMLDATGSGVLWHVPMAGATRVAVGTDGTVAVLAGSAVHLYSGSSGMLLRRVDVTAAGRADVAVDATHRLVFVTGHVTRSVNGATARVAFLRAYRFDGTLAWRRYEFSSAQLEATGLRTGTRGVRLALGRDGMLYLAGEAAGGTSIFQRSPADPAVRLGSSQLISWDKYNQTWQVPGGVTLGWYARFRPSDGELALAQFVTARRSNGDASSTLLRSIAADAAGRVLIAGRAECCTHNRDTRRVAGNRIGAYAGPEAFLLVLQPDLRRRLAWTPFGISGHHSAATAVATGGGISAVAGQLRKGTMVTQHAVQDRASTLADGYLAAWGSTAPPPATSTMTIITPAAGATVSGAVNVVTSAPPEGVQIAEVELLVNGVVVESRTGAPWTFVWNTDAYQGGSHALRVRMYDTAGNAVTSPSVSVVVRDPNSEGLAATYFNSTNFATPVLRRVDPTVNFDWGSASPGTGVLPDRFTVRWEGSVEAPTTETYTFYPRTDDGVRLWVNGRLIVNQWIDQGPTETSGQVALVAGRRYNIVMEYFENRGGAVAQLRWRSFTTPKAVIPARRLSPRPVPVPVPSTGLRSTFWNSLDYSGPSVTRVDPRVNFTWGTGAPDYRIGRDRFSARWSGWVVPPKTGRYRMFTTTDDGVRLWVRGKLVVNRWGDQAPTTHAGWIWMKKGVRYRIRLDYYERYGGAVARLHWRVPGTTTKRLVPRASLRPDPPPPAPAPPPSPPPPPVQGLTATIFDNADFSGTSISRIDPQLNFNWGTGAPDPRIGADTFSIRWTGSIDIPREGTYTFHTWSDDGVRLFVNGQKVLENWTLHGPMEDRGTITLPAGRYPIRMEYFENTGGAVAQLRWSSSSFGKQLVPASAMQPW